MGIINWPTPPDFDENDQPVPGTGQTTAEQYGQLFSYIIDGVAGTPLDSSLRVSGDVGGMFVRVNLESGSPAFGAIRGQAFIVDEPQDLPIEAASGTLRFDLVVARHTLATRAVTLEVVAGVPGAGGPPAAEASSGVYDLPLAIVRVTGSAVTINPSDITDARRFIGREVGVWANSNRPAGNVGVFGFNTESGVWEGWNGTGYGPLTPELTWSAITGKPSAFPPASHTHAATEITSGTLADARIPSLPASRIGSGEFALARIPTIPVNNGGTGATSAAAARSNLGAAASSHTHNAADITGGTLTRPIDQGFGGNRLGGLAVDNSLNVGSSVSAGGNGTFNGAWNNDVGAVTRRAVWMSSNGTLGHTSSSRRYKKAIRRAETDPEAILALEAKYYEPRSKKWEKEQDHAPTYIGFMAEDLHDAGLWEFVWYDEKGRPDGIHYELLGIAAIIAARALNERVTAIEERLAALEGN